MSIRPLLSLLLSLAACGASLQAAPLEHPGPDSIPLERFLPQVSGARLQFLEPTGSEPASYYLLRTSDEYRSFYIWKRMDQVLPISYFQLRHYLNGRVTFTALNTRTGSQLSSGIEVPLSNGRFVAPRASFEVLDPKLPSGPAIRWRSQLVGVVTHTDSAGRTHTGCLKYRIRALNTQIATEEAKFTMILAPGLGPIDFKGQAGRVAIDQGFTAVRWPWEG